MAFKTGRLSKEEKAKLVEWYQSSTVEDMAKRLNRRVDAVEEFVKTYAPKVQANDVDKDLLLLLHSRVYWIGIQDQFSERELREFEVYWVELMKQFNNDVEFSEELQLVDLVKISILVNRNYSERNKSKKELEILQGKLDLFTDKHGYPPYMDKDNENVQDIGKMNEYTTLSQGVKFCEASYTSRTNELTSLSNKKDAYYKDLKATRSMRIEVLKNIKKDFVGLIKSLMDEKIRSKEGLETALMNAAAEKEFKRLSEYHTYSDGVLDRPILNSDVLEQEKEDIEDGGK